jgi:hypothetical protein
MSRKKGEKNLDGGREPNPFSARSREFIAAQTL